MQTYMVEVSIPEELQPELQAQMEQHSGDLSQYVSELIKKELERVARKMWLYEAFQAVDQKYGEALANLAK